MDIIFADDARQRKPSRPGMGEVVAIGGIHVSGDGARALDREIDLLCATRGFPPGEEFKWSPGPGLWMHDNLKGDDRAQFFASVLSLVESNGANAIVVVEDSTSARATDASSPEEDVTRLFLERAHYELGGKGSDGIVIVDRPSGDRKAEDRFLGDCLETLQSGTDYVRPDRIAFIVATPSKFVRLLQLADLITSCTTAAVSGEERHAPPIFDLVKRLLCADSGRIGGVGLKIHPDFKYANLYYWLLGDSMFRRRNIGVGLPFRNRPYSTSAKTY